MPSEAVNIYTTINTVSKSSPYDDMGCFNSNNSLIKFDFRILLNRPMLAKKIHSLIMTFESLVKLQIFALNINTLIN